MPGAAGQTQESPGLDLSIDGNWIQECTDQKTESEEKQAKPSLDARHERRE